MSWRNLNFLFLTLYQIHDNAVPVEVVGLRDGEAPVVEGLHVGKLFGRRDPGQVQPTHLLPGLVVVTLLTDFPKKKKKTETFNIF